MTPRKGGCRWRWCTRAGAAHQREVQEEHEGEGNLAICGPSVQSKEGRMSSPSSLSLCLSHPFPSLFSLSFHPLLIGIDQGGDIKIGKLEPFAYIPLDMKNLNKRYHLSVISFLLSSPLLSFPLLSSPLPFSSPLTIYLQTKAAGSEQFQTHRQCFKEEQKVTRITNFI